MTPGREGLVVMRGRWCTMLALALFALYAATACPTIGPGDSGELAVALSSWGVPHAPGYPLLSIIGNIVHAWIPWGREPASVLNLMNAAFAAAACGVVASAVAIETGVLGAGLVAGLALGTSRVFWLHALALEVFSFNALMAALLLWLLCAFHAGVRDARPRWTLLPAALFVMTTCITHHTTLVLLALPVAVAMAVLAARAIRWGEGPERPGPLAWSMLLALAIGLLPLLYPVVAASKAPPMSWGDVRSLADLPALIARRDFGTGTLLSPAIVIDQVLAHGEAASPLGQRNLIAFVTGIPRDFGWAFPVLVLMGIAWAMRRARAVGLVALGFAVFLVAFFTRVNTPMLPLYASVTERFHILPHVVFALLAGFGAAALAGPAERVRAPQAVLLAALALVTGGAMLVVQFRAVNQRHNTFARDFGADLLSGMPPRSLFFATGDQFHNSVLYQLAALRVRRDVAMVEQDLLPFEWYVRQLRYRRVLRLPEAMTRLDGTPATASSAWLALNAETLDAGARPIVAVRFIDDSWRERYRLEPRGIVALLRHADTPRDLAAQARACANAARAWSLASVGDEPSSAGWEVTEDVFYAYALGQLQGMRDVLAFTDPASNDVTRVPALERASAWTGRLGAEFRAQRADLLREWIEGRLDSAQTRGPGVGATLAPLVRSADSLARAALAMDAGNSQALRTLAALMARQRRDRDEFEFRQRIVDRAPGDFAELEAYFGVALRAMRAAPADTAVTGRVTRTRARLMRLLVVCDRLDPNAGFQDVARRWAAATELPSAR